MTDKQILDRLESINLSHKQKLDLIDVIKDVINNSNTKEYCFYIDTDKQTIKFDNIIYNYIEKEDSTYYIKSKELYSKIKNKYILLNFKGPEMEIKIYPKVITITNNEYSFGYQLDTVIINIVITDK